MEESDIPALSAMMRTEWEDELAKNGLGHVPPKEPVDEDAARNGVTCPACGTTAPLDSGECSDCGLYLG